MLLTNKIHVLLCISNLKSFESYASETDHDEHVYVVNVDALTDRSDIHDTVWLLAISKNTAYHDPYDEHGQCTAGAHVIYNVYDAHNEYLTRSPERFLTPLTVSKWVLGSGRVLVTLFLTNGNVMALRTSPGRRGRRRVTEQVLFTAIINASVSPTKGGRPGYRNVD